MTTEKKVKRPPESEPRLDAAINIRCTSKMRRDFNRLCAENGWVPASVARDLIINWMNGVDYD